MKQSDYNIPVQSSPGESTGHIHTYGARHMCESGQLVHIAVHIKFKVLFNTEMVGSTYVNNVLHSHSIHYSKQLQSGTQVVYCTALVRCSEYYKYILLERIVWIFQIHYYTGNMYSIPTSHNCMM